MMGQLCDRGVVVEHCGIKLPLQMLFESGRDGECGHRVQAITVEVHGAVHLRRWHLKDLADQIGEPILNVALLILGHGYLAPVVGGLDVSLVKRLFSRGRPTLQARPVFSSAAMTKPLMSNWYQRNFR